MTLTPPLVATVLVGWTFASFACARRAERRVLPRLAPPSPIAIVAAVAVVSGIAALRPASAQTLACGIACIGLIAAADSDARTGYLFDAVTFPAALLVVVAVAAGSAQSAALWGVALLAGSFGAIVLASRGRLMGLGDVKALFALGAAFGPLESLIAIFAACVSGISAATLAGSVKRGTSLPFGPHLAAGAVFSLLWGDDIVHHLMGL